MQHALESNVDLVKKFYELFKKGDKQYMQMCDDNLEWVTMHGMPNGGTYVGKKQVFEDYFPRLFANFAEFHAVTDQFFGADQMVIVTGRYQGLPIPGKNLTCLFLIFTPYKTTKYPSSGSTQIRCS